MELLARHGAHHHDNLKYGYILFCVSVGYSLLVALLEFLHVKRWSTSQSHPHNSLWQKLRPQNKWWLHILIWFAIVVAITFIGIHKPIENYATIAKRLGRLAYSLVPLDVCLVIRPSLLTNSYLELVTLHKWFLRLIILMVFFHGIGFCVKWLLEGTFWSKAAKLDNLLGELALCTALILSIISVRPIRTRIYRIFYAWHNFVVLLFLVPIYWHARPGVTDFILLLVAMLIFQFYQKVSGVYSVSNMTIIGLDSSSLQVLKLPKPINYPAHWLAGSHIRLSYPMTDYKYWLFPSHPYTIASNRDDPSIDLVVHKTSRFRVYSSSTYTLSGPSSGLPIPFYESAKKVVILCGGSGISLGAPLFRDLATRSPSSSKLVWCTSNLRDTFVLNELGLSQLAEVYITRGKNSKADNSGVPNEQSDSLLGNNEEIELRPLSGGLESSSDKAEQVHLFEKQENINYGRPDLDSIFSCLDSSEANDNNWIIVCGPESMINEATSWGKAKNVLVFSEYYGF